MFLKVDVESGKLYFKKSKDGPEDKYFVQNKSKKSNFLWLLAMLVTRFYSCGQTAGTPGNSFFMTPEWMNHGDILKTYMRASATQWVEFVISYGSVPEGKMLIPTLLQVQGHGCVNVTNAAAHKFTLKVTC